MIELNVGGFNISKLSAFNYSFLLFIFSEFMIFFTFFWTYFHYRFLSYIYLFFNYPPLAIIFIYVFSLPFTNLLILLFSSLPIQSALIFIKSGLQLLVIEGLGQNFSNGFLFICIQFKEYIFAFFNFSDSIFGSIFYFTTALHGSHVLFGALIILNLLFLNFISINSFFTEFHQSLKL